MLHINRFVDRLKSANDRNQRDFTMSIADARDLHADITKLLLVIQTLQETANKASSESVVSVEVSGGTF